MGQIRFHIRRFDHITIIPATSPVRGEKPRFFGSPAHQQPQHFKVNLVINSAEGHNPLRFFSARAPDRF